MIQPQQPLVMSDGVVRFQRNKVVQLLIDTGKLNLNDIWILYRSKTVSLEDLVQLYQLIGYSVNGFSEVFGNEDEALCDLIHNHADVLVAERKKRED
jgi:hypothetical protein